jgi:4-amino-4-deoxy-L-arabinose transferase-like glycosyltransferase
LPYFLFFPKAIFNGVKNIFSKEKNADFLLAAWFVAGWFIFEFTPSKLPAYVIAAHVPLSLLIAKLLMNEAPKKAMLYIHIALNGIIYLALIVAPIYMGFTKSIQITFTVAGVLFLLASVFILRNRNSDKFSHYLMVKNVAFQLVLWCVLLPVADELKNGSLRVAQHVEQVATKDAQVIIANNFSHPPSLPFYLMQRFDNVSEEYNNESLLKHFNNKNTVLILTREQKEFLVQHHPDLSYTEIKPFFTDRIQQDGYFVVRNYVIKGLSDEVIE